jgi:hypothetical protein
MSGEFDLNREFEEGESRSYSEPTMTSIDKLRTEAKRGYVMGCVITSSAVLLFVPAFFAPIEQVNLVFLPLMITSFILVVVGMGIILSKGTGPSHMAKVYGILQRLGPPEPQLMKRHVAKEYEDVYIIGASLQGMLYFVAFKEQAGLTGASKMSIPRAVWQWDKRVMVSGFKLYRREGVFSVPTDHGDFISGNAVLYAAPYVPSEYNPRVPEFTKEELLAIINCISEDVGNPTRN